MQFSANICEVFSTKLLQCWISLASGGWDLCRLSLHEHNKVLLLLGELQALLYQLMHSPPLTGF